MGLPVTKVGWSKWEKENRVGNRAHTSGSEILRACDIYRSGGTGAYITLVLGLTKLVTIIPTKIL